MTPDDLAATLGPVRSIVAQALIGGLVARSAVRPG